MSSFFNAIKTYIVLMIIIIMLVCVFFTPFISNANISNNNLEIDSEEIKLNPNGFIWPSPGYTKINCPFGKRDAPTSGASTYHKGVDIGAPEGSCFVAVCDGEITYTGFLGGGGYTITLSTENLKITYCHVNPRYIVNVGEFVRQGQIIGYVGPKYVYDVPRQYLYRFFRKSNKWSYHRPTSSFWNKSG